MNVSNWLIYSIAIILIHLFLQFRSYKIWPDWDTSNHLYFGYLLKKKIKIKSSYSFGIKWILPRIYSLLKEENYYKFLDHLVLTQPIYS